MTFSELVAAAFPHTNHGPLVEEGDIRCDYLHCVAGMGVAGAGRCHRGGDPRVKDCPLFEDEETALADMANLYQDGGC